MSVERSHKEITEIDDEITERKSAEEKLWKNEQRAQALLNASTETMILIDSEGIIFAINETGAQRHGKRADELIGKCIYDFLPSEIISPETVEFRKAQIDKVLRTGEPVRFEDKTKTSVIDHSWYPVFDAQGNVERVAIFGRDITDHKRAEEKIEAVNRELESTNLQLEKAIERANQMALETEIAYIELNRIFNIAGDGMVVLDKDFNVLRTNDTFSTLSGTSKDEAVGKKCYEVFPGIACHTPGCSLIRILNGEQHVEYDVEKKRNDGITIPCIVTATPFHGLGGELIGILENFKDITERKRLRQEKLEKEKLKGVLEMAGAVCHELNQPMQAISGYSQLVMVDMSEDNPMYADINEIMVQINKMAEIMKKMGGITRYKTRDYIGETRIIDIDKASRVVK